MLKLTQELPFKQYITHYCPWGLLCMNKNSVILLANKNCTLI